MSAGQILRKLVVGVAVLMALYALKLPTRDAEEGSAGSHRPWRVALFVNGTLGDKSFYDSAARGLRESRDSFGMQTRVVEAGLDPTRWESSLVDVVDGGDFDLVITGGFAMSSLVERLAPRFPATRFMVFDATVDRSRCACPNVNTVVFRQNEGSFLAGFMAAGLTDQSKGEQTLGVVGAMQIPVIDDFIDGFTAGAKRAKPGIRVVQQYVNSFTDPATAKEIAKAMYGRGASLIFQVAAGSGQGVIEAAEEANRYVIGVDSDQFAIFKASNPQRARHIVSSVMKNVDVAVVRQLRRLRDGAVEFGQAESLGLREGGVSLASGSDVMRQMSPGDLAILEKLRADVVAGEVSVPSAFRIVGQKEAKP